MTDWVAVSVDIHDDPKVSAFAKALGVPYDSAAMRLVQIWGRLARHENEEGKVGDLDDETIESWAGWRGKAGRFAPEFRSRFTREGTVNGWWDWNGRHLRKARQDRERSAERRKSVGGESADDSAENPQTVAREFTGNTGTVPNRTSTKPENNDNSAREHLLGRFAEGLHRDAVDRALRSARNPTVLAADLKARLDGMAGHQAAAPEEIGQALHDMQASADPPALTPKVLDIWVTRGRQPVAPAAGESDIDRALRLAQERKAG